MTKCPGGAGVCAAGVVAAGTSYGPGGAGVCAAGVVAAGTSLFSDM